MQRVSRQEEREEKGQAHSLTGEEVHLVLVRVGARVRDVVQDGSGVHAWTSGRDEGR
jgi:hypothetical protein